MPSLPYALLATIAHMASGHEAAVAEILALVVVLDNRYPRTANHEACRPLRRGGAALVRGVS